MIITTNIISTTAESKSTELWNTRVKMSNSAYADDQNIVDLFVKERMDWLCANDTHLPTLNANGDTSNFCTLAMVTTMRPLTLGINPGRS